MDGSRQQSAPPIAGRQGDRMTKSRGKTVEDLVNTQPRTLRVLMDLYEGLALYCEQAEKEADTQTREQAETFQSLYEEQVGIPVHQRNEIRKRVDAILAGTSPQEDC